MKIEKINENQIRCTLNRSDLENREIKLSELAYGTDKAKDLFREMIQQASHQFGFEADNIPLMVEAIPLSPDCIVLIITKVEDPEELDSRFSRFSPASDMEEIDGYEAEAPEPEGIDELSNLFRTLRDEILSRLGEAPGEKTADGSLQKPADDAASTQDGSTALPENFTKLVKVYSFRQLRPLCDAARVAAVFSVGSNTLYKSRGSDGAAVYYLLVHPSAQAPADFNRVCNVLSEYGRNETSPYACEPYFKEHFPVLIPEDALAKLADMK